MRFSFRKHQRVIRSNDFTRAIRQGGCASDGTLVVHAIAVSPSRPARLGVTIPKKVGDAVVRNRWKRLIRESFRTQQDEFPAGWDYIVRPKKGGQPRYSAIRQSLPRLAKKAAQRAR